MGLKGLIRKALIGPHAMSDYIALGIPVDHREPTILVHDGNRSKVLASCILYDPAMISICFPEGKAYRFKPSDRVVHLEFMDKGGTRGLSMIELVYERTVSFTNHELFLFRAIDANLKLNGLKQKFISYWIYQKLQRKHKSFLSAFNPAIYRTLSAFFTHPRFTQLLTLKPNDQQEIHFPIDLYTHVDNGVLFGLRNSNRITEHLIEGARLCLSDVRVEHKTTVYSLGKFGGNAPDGLKKVSSEVLGLYIPDVFHTYLELELTELMRYDNQTIYRSRVLNQFIEKKNDSLLLSHIQLLRYLKSPID